MRDQELLSSGVKARRHVGPALTVLIGTFISVVAFFVASYWERQMIHSSFQREAKNHVETLRRELSFDLDTILSLKAFYDSSDAVDRAEFGTFTTPLLALHPSVQALEWIPRIPHDERDHWERAAEAEGIPNFRITEREAQGKMRNASDRFEYFPVYFVEPYRGNEIALGFDLGSNPVRRRALDDARDRGSMVATGRITLVQETAKQYGTLVVAPIYRKGMRDNTVEAHQEGLLGYVLGVFRIGKMVDKSLSYLTTAGIDVALYDGSAPPQESLLAHHSSEPALSLTPLGTEAPAGSGDCFEHVEELPFADRLWRIVLRSTPAFAAARGTTHPWEVVGSILLLTAMLAAYFVIHQRNEWALRDSEGKYRQLFEMESDAILLVDNSTGRLFEVNPAACILYGYSREELLETNLADLQGNPDSPAETAPEADLRTPVYFHRRKGGSVFPVEIATRRFYWRGRDVHVAAIRDVTERRQAEEALHRSCQLYAKAEQVGNFGHWDRNLRNEGFSWSEGMYHILGLDPAAYEMTFDTFLALIHPSDREAVEQEIAGATPEKGALDFEFRIIRPDGEERIVRAIGDKRFADNGRAIASFGIAQDITVQKQTEAQLKEGEERYRSLFTNNHAVMLLVDPETTAIVDANPAACSYYGYPYDHLLQLKVQDINTLTAEQIRVKMELARTEQRNRFYYSHRLSGGQIREVEVYSGPIRVAGKELLYSIVNDVTERKRAEDELRQANEYLENVFQNSPDGIGIADKSGRLISWNRMAVEQFGYGPEELSFIATSDLYADQKELRRMLDELRREGAVRRYPINMKKKDGTIATFELSLSLLKDPGGRTLGSVCVARDLSDIQKALTAVEASNQRLQQEIAERERIEETLRESERRFRAILENVHLLAVSLDVEGRITFCNDFLLKATGWLREDLFGHNWFDIFFPPSHGEDKRQTYEAAIAHGAVATHNEDEIITCFGKTCLISWDNTLLRDPQGKVIGVTKIGRDIGLRRKIERELREASAEMELLIASIPSVLIEVSEGNRVIRWNSASERTFGLAAIDVMGELLHHCPLQWDWSRLSEGLRECRSQGTSIRLDDLRFMRPGGKDGLLGLVVSPIRSELDEPMGLIILGADVTDHRLLERQLAQAQKLESIGQLAAGIAHEINTPTQYVGDNTRFLLGAFHDLVQLLDQYARLPAALEQGEPLSDLLRELTAAEEEADFAYLKEEIPRAIEQSLEGVERVSKIVGAMKEFSHPGTTEKTAININQAIESTITVARNEWKYIAEMVTDFDRTLPLISCIPGEFNQVVLNMIINSAHAIAEALEGSAGRKGTITVATRNLGELVEIRISDTGTGIPDDIRSRIFDPFFTTKEVGKGTGQGLTIAHSVIVDKHGGTINLETEMGKGTTFIVTLPIAEPQGLKGAQA